MEAGILAAGSFILIHPFQHYGRIAFGTAHIDFVAGHHHHIIHSVIGRKLSGQFAYPVDALLKYIKIQRIDDSQLFRIGIGDIRQSSSPLIGIDIILMRRLVYVDESVQYLCVLLIASACLFGRERQNHLGNLEWTEPLMPLTEYVYVS